MKTKYMLGIYAPGEDKRRKDYTSDTPFGSISVNDIIITKGIDEDINSGKINGAKVTKVVHQLSELEGECTKHYIYVYTENTSSL